MVSRRPGCPLNQLGKRKWPETSLKIGAKNLTEENPYKTHTNKTKRISGFCYPSEERKGIVRQGEILSISFRKGDYFNSTSEVENFWGSPEYTAALPVSSE